MCHTRSAWNSALVSTLARDDRQLLAWILTRPEMASLAASDMTISCNPWATYYRHIVSMARSIKEDSRFQPVLTDQHQLWDDMAPVTALIETGCLLE